MKLYRIGMQTAINVSQWSDDPDTQTGCAIFKPGDPHPIAVGANRLPVGIDKTQERVNRPSKYQWLEHAERNAIYGVSVRNLHGTVAFLNWFPCCDCSRALVAVGILELVYVIKPERWNDPRYAFDVSKAILEAGGIKLTPYESVNHD